jgi:hypothetical protein
MAACLAALALMTRSALITVALVDVRWGVIP